MRSKATLVLLLVFIALLAVVLFLKPKVKEEAELKLTDLKVEDVQKISLKKGAEDLVFQKDDKGEWAITRPLAAKADAFEVNRLAEDFASLKVEKVVEPQAQDKDLAQFGIPQSVVSLWAKGRAEPVVVDIGSENPLDNTLYARLEGDPRVVLLPSLVKSSIDKKLFDFRQKDVFHFDTAEVASIALESKNMTWDAVSRGGEWFLQKPVAGLAQKSKVDALLSALSGLRAKDFASERKTPEDLKTYGLDKPEYKVGLALLPSNSNLAFLVRKKDDKVYVTTSISNTIVVAEDQLLTDLEKKPADLREKRLDPFNAWEADKLELRRDGLSIAVSRGRAGQWTFLSGETGAADDSRVESFIRLIGSQEAVELIDKPGPLHAYGLDKPQAEVRVETAGEGDKKHEISLIVGTEDKTAKQVVIRNAKFDYLFRVGSAFLDEFPKAAKDWKKEEPKDKTP